jgi:hypothetical protein
MTIFWNIGNYNCDAALRHLKTWILNLIRCTWSLSVFCLIETLGSCGAGRNQPYPQHNSQFVLGHGNSNYGFVTQKEKRLLWENNEKNSYAVREGTAVVGGRLRMGTNCSLRFALFWDVTRRRMVIVYRRFGTTCRSLGDGADMLSRNVGKQLPGDAA